MGAKLFFQRGAVHPGLDAGGPGCFVNLQRLIQAAQVYGDDAVVTLRRFHAAHHRTAPAVGNGGVAPAGTPVQQCRHVVFIAGEGHHVRRVGEVEVEGPNSVLEVAAVGVDGALVGVGGTNGRQGVGDGDAGRAQVQVAAGGHGRDVYGDTVLGGQGGCHFPPLGLGGFVGLHSPGPETSPWH